MESDCPTCSAMLDRLRTLEANVAWLKEQATERASRKAQAANAPRPITPAQLRTIRAIRSYWRDYSVGPRMEDLGKRLGITKQAAAERVKHLVGRGFVARDPRLARSVRVLYDPDQSGVA